MCIRDRLAGVPADRVAVCGEALPAAATINVTATDNCDAEVTINFAETTEGGEGGCAAGITIIRTWTATDACGNISSQSQRITSSDTEAPTLTGVPNDVTVSCDNIPSATTPTATDNCDENVSVSLVEIQNAGSCASNYVLVRTWTATDACGNETEATQLISVEDNDAPVLQGVPADRTAACGEALPASETINVTATDNCDAEVVVTFTEITEGGEGGCAAGVTIIRTWTATDACGNVATATQRIGSSDTEAPVLAGVPNDETVSCDNIPSAATPTATDNCDENVLVALEETQNAGSCASNYILVRTWKAIDACGNETEAIQLISVEDNDAPVLDGVPADRVVACSETLPVASAATVTARDNCDNDVQISFAETTENDPNGCASGNTVIRTWTATDACGNVTTGTQRISRTDDTLPVLSEQPSDLAVSCDAVPIAPTLTATDNCDANVRVVFGEAVTSGDCLDSYTLVRTWTATDACGNSTETTQTITVADNMPPVLAGVPADIEVGCGEAASVAMPTITASDDCDTDVEITFSETCLLYTSPSPRDRTRSRMPSSA